MITDIFNRVWPCESSDSGANSLFRLGLAGHYNINKQRMSNSIIRGRYIVTDYLFNIPVSAKEG